MNRFLETCYWRFQKQLCKNYPLIKRWIHIFQYDEPILLQVIIQTNLQPEHESIWTAAFTFSQASYLILYAYIAENMRVSIIIPISHFAKFIPNGWWWKTTTGRLLLWTILSLHLNPRIFDPTVNSRRGQVEGRLYNLCHVPYCNAVPNTIFCCFHVIGYGLARRCEVYGIRNSAGWWRRLLLLLCWFDGDCPS